MGPPVYDELSRLDEALAADVAGVRPLARVYAKVAVELARVLEGAAAHLAGVGALLGVDAPVHAEVLLDGERLGAVLAGVGALPGVDAVVARQAGRHAERLVAPVALELLLEEGVMLLRAWRWRETLLLPLLLLPLLLLLLLLHMAVQLQVLHQVRVVKVGPSAEVASDLVTRMKRLPGLLLLVVLVLQILLLLFLLVPRRGTQEDLLLSSVHRGAGVVLAAALHGSSSPVRLRLEDCPLSRLSQREKR